MDDSITARQILEDVVGIVKMRGTLGEVMELTPAPLALWTLGGAAAVVAVRHRLETGAAAQAQETAFRKIMHEVWQLPPGEFADQVLRPWTYGHFVPNRGRS